MDCTAAREIILDALLEPLDAAQRQSMEGHLADCETCRRFAAVQQALDARLSVALPAVRVSSGFRKSLKQRMRRDPLSAWPDFLPELAHLGGCSVATGLLVFLLPLPPGSVILAGAAFTTLTLFLQPVVRGTLEGLAGDA